MQIAMYLIFFVSGFAALLFEIVWFRLAGIALGSSVWSATTVLSSFMGGLALGGTLAGRYSNRIRQPLRFFVLLQVIIGITGCSLVMLLPHLAQWFAIIFRPFLDSPIQLSSLRLIIAFALMLAPSTAMGMTLPLLVRCLPENMEFGQRFGGLYGWNTLGSLGGALAGDLVVVRLVGLQGAGLFAALLYFVAAAASYGLLRLYGGRGAKEVADRKAAGSPLSSRQKRLLAGSFLGGMIILAFEVVWFRFLLLFFSADIVMFSIMLSVILAGMGAGALFARHLLQSKRDIQRTIPSLFLAAGAIAILTYSTIHAVLLLTAQLQEIAEMIILPVHLMFPVSLLSGMIFVILADSFHHAQSDETRSSGRIFAVNTLGGMLGAGVAGLVLLPALGMERSFFLLSILYGLSAIVALTRDGLSPWYRMSVQNYAAAGIFLAAIVFFPFGSMQNLLQIPRSSFYVQEPDLVVAAVREGMNETLQYLRKELFGQPLQYRLVTNNHSMSANDIVNRRYMKLFVYLPVAMNPHLQDALLIAYGIGNTAKALTDTRQIRSLDIVDISQDIIDLSNVVFPERSDNPVYDKRTMVHIEDGRFFLQASDRRYDLITSEPPPLKNIGVVNLYSEEYFRLLYAHLNDNGIVTYWLPVVQLTEAESRSVIKGFCNVFDDCSLWKGSRLDLIMVGTRGLHTPVSESDFARQWQDPAVMRELETIGVEKPDQLETLLLLDTPDLKELVKEDAPLTDNYPYRLWSSAATRSGSDGTRYWQAMLNRSVPSETSPTIRRLWPERYKNTGGAYLIADRIINEVLFGGGTDHHFDDLHWILTKTSLKMPVLFLMGSNNDIQRVIAKGMALGLDDREFPYHLAARYLAERHYAEAQELLARYQPGTSGIVARDVYFHRIYLYLLAGQRDEAARLARQFLGRAATGELPDDPTYWEWLYNTFNLRVAVSSPLLHQGQ